MRDALAAILTAATDKYSAWFEQGVAMTSHLDQENWYLAHDDVAQTKDLMDTYGNAVKALGDYDEPASVDDWSTDTGNVTADIHNWYFSATLEHGPDPAFAAKVRADFAAARQDIANLEAGK